MGRIVDHPKTTIAIVLVAVCLTFRLASAGPCVHNADEKDDEPRLGLDQAREYLLELINKDRAALGRPPVQMDAVSSGMGLKQSEQMVRLAAMSHADMQGRLAAQRYTDAGGKDRVRENVSLQGVKSRLDEPVELETAPTFTRTELEAIEAGYFNEIPPNDGHRVNVLRTEHTHVGIGLARGKGDNAGVIGNAEEFVDRYVDELSAIPAQVALGSTVRVQGRLSGGRKLVSMGIARGLLPHSLDRVQFKAMGHYAVPSPYVKFWPDESGSVAKVEMQRDGRFSIQAPLNDDGKPGLYYISLTIDDPLRGEVIASLRTVVVNAKGSLAEGRADRTP